MTAEMVSDRRLQVINEAAFLKVIEEPGEESMELAVAYLRRNDISSVAKRVALASATRQLVDKLAAGQLKQAVAKKALYSVLEADAATVDDATYAGRSVRMIKILKEWSLSEEEDDMRRLQMVLSLSASWACFEYLDCADLVEMDICDPERVANYINAVSHEVSKAKHANVMRRKNSGKSIESWQGSDELNPKAKLDLILVKLMENFDEESESSLVDEVYAALGRLRKKKDKPVNAMVAIRALADEGYEGAIEFLVALGERSNFDD